MEKIQDQIIAIKILSGCDSKYKKNLEVSKYYYLNKSVDLERNNELIENNPRLYDYTQIDKQEINVNIGAIVGRNGSGKSTLIELVIAALYNIANDFGNVKSRLDSLNLELVFTSGEHLVKLDLSDSTQKGAQAFRLDLDSNCFSIPEKDYEFKVGELPYFIGLNYSLFSLNSLETGPWIDNLFHKNDSYQIPIGLNPHRVQGVIDVNKENHLVKDRLLTNIFSFNSQEDVDYDVIPGKQILSLNYYWDSETREYTPSQQLLKGELEKHNILGLLGVVRSNIREKEKAVLDNISQYITRKVVRMCYTYPQYSKYVKFKGTLLPVKEDKDSKTNTLEYSPFEESDFHRQQDIESVTVEFKGLVKALKADESHVAFKLHRAINFINHFKKLHADNDYGEIGTVDEIGNAVSIELEFGGLKAYRDKIVSFVDKINKENSTNKKYTEFLLPFNLDINLKSKEGGNDDIIKFSTLSSGEKQKIYSINTLLYHARNIDSVSDDLKYKYNSVTYLMDEIELYFHPEMQRTYINDLLDIFKRNNFKRINTINFTFVTHSPYILSDIPSQFVTKLDEGKVRDEEGSNSFAGNIHEMLNQDFFMKSSTGEFAKSKIGELKRFLLAEKESTSSLDKNSSKRLIELIGEPIIKNVFQRLWSNKFPDSKDQRIQELEEELKKLKNGTRKE